MHIKYFNYVLIVDSTRENLYSETLQKHYLQRNFSLSGTKKYDSECFLTNSKEKLRKNSPCDVTLTENRLREMKLDTLHPNPIKIPLLINGIKISTQEC